jgi:TonB-dependent SusC/RagA subfamily outer membrane receptor
MKKSTVLTLLSCFLFFHLSAQNTENLIAKKWLVVYQYELDDLPKSALATVDEIYQLAEKGHLNKQRIKALIYQAKFANTLEENAQLAIINRFKNELKQLKSPEKNILESYLAELYLSYYQQNRWRINSRSRTEEKVDPDDFRTWDNETLLVEVKKHFQNTLQPKSLLQKAPIADYHLLVDPQPNSSIYQPTLYDMLAHKVLKFYADDATQMEAAKDKHPVSDTAYFRTFLATKILGSTVFSPKEASLLIFQELLSFHIEQKQIAATIVLQIEILKYLQSHTQIAGAEHYFEKALKQLKAEYVSDEASTLIDFELASKYYNQAQKKQALAYCETAIEEFPESLGAERCQSLKNEILSLTLSITSEEVSLVDKHSKVLVEYTNVDSLSFSIFKIPTFTKNVYPLLGTDSVKNNFLNTHQAVHQFSINLINPEDYRSHTTEVLLPPLIAGNYLIYVKVLDPSDQLPYAFTTIQVSNIGLISADLEDHKRFQVIDRLNGKPIAEASIQLFKEDRDKAFKTLTTNSKGFAYFDYPKNYLSNIDALVTHQNDQALFTGNYIHANYKNNRNDNKSPVSARVKLLTDRSIYRPGQEIYFKGIFMQQQDGKVKTVAGEYLEVTLENVNHEEVGMLRLKTNEFGSIEGTFKLPKNGLNGKYTLTADEDDQADSQFYDEVLDDFEYSSTSIAVEEYKRPTFELIFDPITASYSLNDSVAVSATAKAFSGASLSNAKVSYTVSRKTQYQPWYYRGYSKPYYNQQEEEIVAGTTKTDSKGDFEILFKAIPDADSDASSQPIFIYEINAQVTDINGESRSNSTEVKLAYHRLQANINLAERINKGDKEFTAGIEITNLNDQRVKAIGQLSIIKLVGPEKIQIEKKWQKPDLPIISEEEYEKYFPLEGQESSLSKEEWPNGDTLNTQAFDTHRLAEISLAAKKDWPLGKYVASLTTHDSLGNSVKANSYFELFNPKAKQLAEKQLLSIETDKTVYQVGDKVKLKIGSSSPDIYITVDFEKNNKIEESRIIHLSDEVKTIEIPMENAEKEGFAIFYHYANFNTFEKGTKLIEIQQEIPQLEITTNTFRDKLLPGAEEKWSFTVLGEDKEQKQAEMLASMYDASLDHFKRHQWSFKPIDKTTYNAYNRSNANGFSTKRFMTQNLYRNYYRNPTPSYSELNWFGFYNERQYLNRLRSVFFTQNILRITQSHDKKKEAGYIYGTVLDKEGAALPGVNILVKGSKRASVTDIDGRYSIAAKKGDKLLLSFIGLESTEIKIGDQNTIDIVLKTDVQQLSEVVVTGYATTLKREITGSTSKIEMADEEEVDMASSFQEKVARLQEESWSPSNDASGAADRIVIRGSSSINANPPLYVVDGKIATDMELSPEDIAAIEVLKGASAIAIYGAGAANGVIIITTKQGQAKLDQMLSQVQARTDLRETAFFYPQLQTNEKGEISFNFTTPEALTRWKLQLLAHNKSLAVGYKSLMTVTQKDLMVSPNAPRFLRKGDQLILSTKISNLSNEALNGTIVLILTDAISGKSVDADFSNMQSQQSFNIASKNTTEVNWTIAVSDNCGALQYKVVATTGSYSDGEQNVIPILSNRELVTESLLFTLREAGTKSFTYQRLKDNQSSSLQQHQLTFELTTNPIWYAIKAMPYLMEYPYECSEQTFSRYFANKLGVQIIAANPAIKTVFEQWKADGNFESKLEQNAELKSLLIRETPWLRDAQSEAEQQQRIALLFDLEKMEEQFQATLVRLEEMQLSDGGFPWFSGSNRANRYISQYIMMGLGQLHQLDTSEQSSKLRNIREKGVRFLDTQLTTDYNKLLAESKRNDNPLDLTQQQIDNTQIQAIYARSFFSDKIPATAQKAYDYYLKQSKTYWKEYELKLRAMIALTHYRLADKTISYKILASLKENSINSEEMGMYWKANKSGYYWMQSPIETQALIISLFDEIGSEAPKITKEQLTTDLENLRVWLLRQKQTNKWPTTKATTQAIHALLLHNEAQFTKMNQVSVSMGHKAIELDSLTSGAGYIKKSWNAQEFDKSMADFTISKEKEGLAFGAVYWQYFETLDKITSDAEGPLSLKKQVFKVDRDIKGEVLKAITDSTQLKLGDKLRIRIVLQSDRRMEFLHMKDQRAAGLEPVDVISEYKWQDGLGYYQSTKDASTNFFFDVIQKGIYVFEYDLIVNNEGNFQNGITTIESMYAPEFKSHSEGIKLNLGK